MAIRKVVAEKKTKVKGRGSPPRDNSDYSGIEELIQPVSEIEQPMTGLFYGRSGTGKTALLGTFPKNLLILDLKEKGTETVAKVEGVNVLEVNTWERFEKTYWYLKSGKHEIATVGLDQISQLQGIGMDWIREEEGMDSSDIFSKRNWGQLSGMLQTWLLNFRDLRDQGINVIFLAHEKIRGDSEDGDDEALAPNVGARLMPSVTGFVNGMVSIIGNTFIREKFTKLPNGKKERKVEYCLRVGPHAYYDTKIRRPKEAGPIPDVIVNPSYKKLVAISRGEELASVTKKRK